MRFRVKTLVDITETRVNRNDGSKEYKQQSNFTTLLQTIGIRVNPIFESSPRIESIEVDSDFGTNVKGEHTVWIWDFDVEYGGGIDIDEMNNMFDLMPVSIDLDETVKINKSVFHTKDKKFKNLIIEEI
jgi:hypothetical protein